MASERTDQQPLYYLNRQDITIKNEQREHTRRLFIDSYNCFDSIDQNVLFKKAIKI